MIAIEELATLHGRMTAWRRHLHAHPETAFAEHATAAYIAERLREARVDAVHTGLAGTGVIGVVAAGKSGRAIGLRADLDALDVTEATGLPYASRTAGKMHACGHDGHMTMLLGAAERLAATRRFDGTVYLIFQPAEENEGGGRRMVEEGLFERFAMESVFGLHNIPGIPAGHFAVMPGPMMASYDIFELLITGRGGHGAMPHTTIDPIVVGVETVQALQTIVSRTVDPMAPAVVSVTQFHAGDTWNVIPNAATIRGTVRAFDTAVQTQVETQIGRLAEGVAGAHGASVAMHYERRYPPTINTAPEAALCARVMKDLVGESRVVTDAKPLMAAEDFAFMLNAKKGAYAWIGNGVGAAGGCMVHNPGYDFNDAILPIGAAYWVRLAEAALA